MAAAAFVAAPHVARAPARVASPLALRHCNPLRRAAQPLPRVHGGDARPRRRPPATAALLPPLAARPAAAILAPFVPPAAAAAAAPFAVWAVLLSAATLGLVAQRTQLGASLTPSLVTTLLTLGLSNFGVLPPAHPIYFAVTGRLLPLAVPLLLLGTDLRRVLTETGRLLSVFVVGAVATVLGTIVAWKLVPVHRLGPHAWKIASALAARHIGGAVNFVAVAEATKAPPALVATALTADNVVLPFYFATLLILARGISQPQPSARDAAAVISASDGKDLDDLPDDDDGTGKTLSASFSIVNAGLAMSISAILCSFAALISELLPFSLGVIPVVTMLVLGVATAFPRRLAPLKKSGTALGVFMMQVFFAVAGAGGSILSVLRRGPLLLLFSVVQISVHLAALLATGKLFRFHRAEVLIASNANVGGPTTAAAMASAKEWDRLIVPSMLVGIFGYSIATFVSLALGHSVLRGG